MPWRVRGARRARRRAIILGTVAAVLVVGGVLGLYVEYALPPCSLEAEPLFRQLNLCR